MEKKKQMMVPAVTTSEALDYCIETRILLFCIENPLYRNLRDQIRKMPALDDYDIQEFPDKEILLLTKVHGNPKFDDLSYEPYYLPLSWDDWMS